MNPEEYVKQMEAKKVKLGDDIYYTLKDAETGDILPLAGLWKSDGYGKEAAEERAAKLKDISVTTIKITEVQ